LGGRANADSVDRTRSISSNVIASNNSPYTKGFARHQGRNGGAFPAHRPVARFYSPAGALIGLPALARFELLAALDAQSRLDFPFSHPSAS
jgi:hypothetical protein